jgi:hypothetical protein
MNELNGMLMNFVLAIYVHGKSVAKIASFNTYLSKIKTKLFMVSADVPCSTDIPAGPYFLSVYTGEVFQAFRLYSDFDGAFTEGVIASKSGNYSTMSASIEVNSLLSDQR